MEPTVRYRVVVTKITEKITRKPTWQCLYTDVTFADVRRQNPDAKQYDYATGDLPTVESNEIYNQTVGGEFDLWGVIQAVNAKSAPGGNPLPGA